MNDYYTLKEISRLLKIISTYKNAVNTWVKNGKLNKVDLKQLEGETK